MCGIAGILNIKAQTKELRDKALKMAQKIRHRGPDWSGIYAVSYTHLIRLFREIRYYNRRFC